MSQMQVHIVRSNKGLELSLVPGSNIKFRQQGGAKRESHLLAGGMPWIVEILGWAKKKSRSYKFKAELFMSPTNNEKPTQ